MNVNVWGVVLVLIFAVYLISRAVSGSSADDEDMDSPFSQVDGRLKSRMVLFYLFLIVLAVGYFLVTLFAASYS
ncbi:MAG: hypothetical protein D6784_07855 [Chloroflexi bacterium]|nr:MAG: hypothetical protein D6784_07855 [Chloroflexota bacterium]